MQIKIKISNKFSNIECEEINKILTIIYKKAKTELDFKNNIIIKVNVAKNPEKLKELGGIGAYCPDKFLIEINLDLTHPDLKKSLFNLLERSVLHEFHHLARRQAGIDIGNTSLKECIISEGMADYFFFEITKKIPVWARPLPANERIRLLKKIKLEWDKKTTDENYCFWFLNGDQKKKIPKWAGYKIGFYLIKDFIKKHKIISVFELTSKTVDELIQ